MTRLPVSIARLATAAAFFAILGAAPAVAGDDSFGGAAVLDASELGALRGGQVIDSFNTIITTSSAVTQTGSIGTFNITANDVAGGDVSINDSALGRFSGFFTASFATAPGSIASAGTSLSITLLP